ncbi:MAG: CRISPR system precrRNA processing endoribonuclease RAMP protein Cas6 [Deltaproteobacteria bacterium]|nr:CRISPR system precrRNA processing endoribonuclease RAMP protein Cas6 [Deltaproteobacteria bacterium]MBW2153812.1 CRISPR system precrRNA processing endoribonuclease RAMP protein Cas6 [Deltaproteobacteria bacterium]
MLYGNYRFICRFETEACLPRYKGSAFRGLFGRALKKTVCALKRQQCPDCILRERCFYVRVFETELLSETGTNARVSAAPHPFVIEPSAESKTHYDQGEKLHCSLLLFGECNRNLPYFVYAFEQMGLVGMGKRADGRLGRFAIEAVLCGDEIIYSENDKVLKATDFTKELSLAGAVLPHCTVPVNKKGNCFTADPSSEDQASQRIRVSLETPLRFKANGRLRDSLPFDMLVRLMLRRVSSLMSAYGGGEPPLDYSGMVRRAGAVRTVESRLRWFDWRRYSSRQEKSMQLGGLLGDVTYQGELGEFLPLLEFCSHVHIGKQTSFGLGKISCYC